jgi:hypothetical protein
MRRRASSNSSPERTSFAKASTHRVAQILE